MSKKKNDDERKPDLNASDEQAELEARIKEMMELEEPKPVSKPISVTMHDDETPATAPELPSTKKPLSIKVVDHNEVEDTAGTPEPEIVETPDPKVDDPDVLAAIEEANHQLMSEVSEDATSEEPESKDAEEKPEQAAEDVSEAEDTDQEPGPETEDAEAEEPAEIEESVDEQLSDNEQEGEEESEPEPENGDEENTEVTEESEPELEQEPETKPPKEKPLKHLDSIVPKSKVEQTLKDKKTDEAVEDIISKESDALLQAEDEKLAEAFQPEPRPRFGQKLKQLFRNKALRVLLALLVITTAAAAAVVPDVRYLVLNTVGVRSSASLVVLDESTQQPLRGVEVALAGQLAHSDQEGKVQFSGLKLGRTELTVEKRAFAPVNKPVTIGWGSNPLNDVSLAPTGSQYRFVVTDFLSGKPVSKVEAVSNEAAAISNEKGEIRLTIDQQDDTPREVVIGGDGYREERFQLDLNQKDELAIKLVPARKHVFISKRSGRFDVYKVDIDGKNEEVVLPGTGSEREDMVLVSHPTEEAVALVSTKDNKRNADGFLLSTLTVINLNAETTKSVATSERVQIVDWVGSRIVYVQVKEGASGDSPDRHKLVSYDYKTQEFKDIASSNYFNDVLVAGGKVYYAPSSTYSGSTSSSFFRVEADGSNKQTILSKEVWNIYRTSYDRLTLAVQQEWYEVKVGELKAGKLGGEPASQTSRIYVDAPDNKRSLWVDNRDGKGVLLAYSSESKQDTTIRTQAGLKQPVRWLSTSTIVYRINTESETADYALNLDGGEPVKIRDVTNTSGINTWYYY